MNDEELIKRLRAYAQIEHAAAPWGFAGEGEVLSTAADRIEALVKERDRYRDAFNTNCLVLRGTEERVERLEAALRAIAGGAHSAGIARAALTEAQKGKS